MKNVSGSQQCKQDLISKFCLSVKTYHIRYIPDYTLQMFVIHTIIEVEKKQETKTRNTYINRTYVIVQYMS